jgi:hypothetical protein
VNKSDVCLTEVSASASKFAPAFNPTSARDLIDRAIIALMLPTEPTRAVKEAFMHCHVAFDGVSIDVLEAYFEGHSAVALKILRSLMSTVGSVEAMKSDEAEGLSTSQRQHFCNALLVVFSALVSKT